MIYLLLFILLISHNSWADIFSKPDDQNELDIALAQDAKNFYYRNNLDYNAFDSRDPQPYELRKEVSLGCNRYDFHESLKNMFTRPEFSNIELEELMQELSTSKLLVWQYSSPTLADLYKHLDTTGRLRLGIRYQQCEDLEKSVDDPTVKLRKQSVMDCMRRKEGSSGMQDIDEAFKSCFDNLHANGSLSMPYASLEDPGNGQSYISGTVNVTDKVLDRINKTGEDLSVIKQIVPKVMVSQNTVTFKGPARKSRELIYSYRSQFVDRLKRIIEDYKKNHSVDPQELSSLSVFGVPLTEGQVRNIVLLDDITGYLAINKISSELGYLKTMDQYLKAVQMLERVMNHPAIEAGYKTLLKSSLDYLQKEIVNLKEEKYRLSEYAQMMHSILDEADERRLKVLSQLKQEAVSEQEKGLLNLNP